MRIRITIEIEGDKTYVLHSSSLDKVEFRNFHFEDVVEGPKRTDLYTRSPVVILGDLPDAKAT